MEVTVKIFLDPFRFFRIFFVLVWKLLFFILTMLFAVNKLFSDIIKTSKYLISRHVVSFRFSRYP
jgi:hypothetical protein